MLVRFSNANGCSTCTQTVDFCKIRAIGMLMAENGTYFVRISFDNGDLYTARKGLTLAEATAYRNLLEGYWSNSASSLTLGDAHEEEKSSCQEGTSI